MQKMCNKINYIFIIDLWFKRDKFFSGNAVLVSVHHRLLWLSHFQTPCDLPSNTAIMDITSQQIQQDWENREFIEILSESVKNIAKFLNNFGKSLHICHRINCVRGQILLIQKKKCFEISEVAFLEGIFKPLMLI